MAGLEDVLRRLLRMDGALCAGIAERDSGRLLAAAGNGAPPNLTGPSLAALARAGTDLDRPDGSADPTDGRLEDVMITSERLFHVLRVLRQVDADDAAPVLVYVRLRRGHGNPAACRRELASAEFRASVVEACRAAGSAPEEAAAPGPTGPTEPTGPTQSRQPSGPARSAQRQARPMPLPPGRSATTAPTTAPTTANATTTANAAPAAPARPAATPVAKPARPSAASAVHPAGTTGPAPGATPRPAPAPTTGKAAARAVAAAVPSGPPEPGPPSVAPPTGAPTNQPTAPPTAGPTNQPTAPPTARPTAAPTDQPPPSDQPPGQPVAGPATTHLPAPRPAAERRTSPPAPLVLPRRVRGSRLVPAPVPAPVPADRPGPTPGVLHQGWANDGQTLRRLLTGLRRMG